MKKLIAVIVTASLLIASCSIFKTVVNLTRLKFRLNSATDIQVAGVSVQGKSKFSDFSTLDIFDVSSSFLMGWLPVTFTLNVEAKNPNDGSGGYPQTNAYIKSFPFRLLINDKEVFTGNIANPVLIPGTGETVNIPIQISFDLLKIFNDKKYEDLVNLVLQVSKLGKGTSNVTLYANPTVSTDFGDITYPGDLKIIDTQFSN
jgi:hypothetical protein